MRPWAKLRLEPQSKSLGRAVGLAVLVAGMLFAGMVQSGCKSSPTTRAAASSREAEVLKSSSAPRTTPPNQTPFCPIFGPTLAPAPAPPAGAHSVLLSWKASAPPDAKHSAAAGYCVYRGTDPKNLPNQLLNPIAFTQGTSCTDNNSVQNGATYYYVVRAVSAGGTPSDSSKPPVPAHIPTTPSKNSGYSAPLCDNRGSVK
jgi:hypothetical protein